MTPVHDGLGISEANWSTFMKIISDGMNEKNYPSDVRDEFLAIWRSFHDGVVQKVTGTREGIVRAPLAAIG